jgi:hypothetical protein
VSNSQTTQQELSRLAKLGVACVVFGFTAFLIGIVPAMVNLDLTSGIGVFQLATILFGIGLMTIGGYMYAYATRHRSMPHRLREDIGLRLMATGYVICAVSGLSDVLGIGTHNLPNNMPYLGLWQSVGLVFGLLVIAFGVLLYAQRYSPKPMKNDLNEENNVIEIQSDQDSHTMG